MSFWGMLTKAGIHSDGNNVEIFRGDILARNFPASLLLGYYGRSWFADSSVGTSGTGKSWSQAKATIEECIDCASAGDRILAVGDFSESSLAIPVTKPNLTLVGAHQNRSGCTITGVSDEIILTVNAVGCAVVNMTLIPSGDTTGAAVFLDKSATVDGAEFSLIGCQIDGDTAAYGLQMDGNCEVKVFDNLFYAMEVAIGAPTLYDAGEPTRLEVVGNRFHSVTRHIHADMLYSVIAGNFFAAAATSYITLTGVVGTGGSNHVTKNVLGGLYTQAAGYVPAAGDNWLGNFSESVGLPTVSDSGITIAVPA